MQMGTIYLETMIIPNRSLNVMHAIWPRHSFPSSEFPLRDHYAHMQIRMIITILFVTAKIRKTQTSKNKLTKLRYIHKMERYSEIKLDF